MKSNPVRNSLLMIVLVMVVTACGFKGNPLPYSVKTDVKPVIKNMEVSSQNETIALKWNLQDKKGVITYIKVERSETGTPGNACKDCPRTFIGIGRIAVEKKRLENEKLNFTDKNVVRGRIYSYRLMLCEENANCSEAATADMKFE